MGVVGTRVPPALGHRVQEHCLGLGKTPSQWVREIIERELSGKTPHPALGDALQGLAASVNDNVKFMAAILAVSVGTYKALLQIEMLDHPERAQQLDDMQREFRERLLESILAREPLTIEVGLRISDLASEIERIKGGQQIAGGP